MTLELHNILLTLVVIGSLCYGLGLLTMFAMLRDRPQVIVNPKPLFWIHRWPVGYSPTGERSDAMDDSIRGGITRGE